MSRRLTNCKLLALLKEVQFTKANVQFGNMTPIEVDSSVKK